MLAGVMNDKATVWPLPLPLLWHVSTAIAALRGLPLPNIYRAEAKERRWKEDGAHRYIRPLSPRWFLHPVRVPGLCRRRKGLSFLGMVPQVLAAPHYPRFTIAETGGEEICDDQDYRAMYGGLEAMVRGMSDADVSFWVRSVSLSSCTAHRNRHSPKRFLGSS